MKCREKRRRYGEPSTRAPNVKFAHFVKNGYGLMAVTSMSAIFNKLSRFAFYLYTSRTSSTYAIGKFYLHSK